MELLIAIFQSPGSTIFNLGPISLRWYGVLIALSVLIGLKLSTYLAKKRNLAQGLVNDLLPILILSSIIGARIYYVIFEWELFSGENFWTSISIFGLNFPIPSALEIWGGGIAIHGALILGTLSVYIFAKYKNINFLNLIDILFPSVVLGQCIGRWGNFFNNEAFGLPTQLPWKLFIPLSNRPYIFLSESYFHPTFLYESVWNFIIFITLITIFHLGLRKIINLPNGIICFTYLIMYGFGRYFIEALRIDPLCINSLPPMCQGGIRMAQLISILFVIIGLAGYFIIYKRNNILVTKEIKSNNKVL